MKITIKKIGDKVTDNLHIKLLREVLDVKCNFLNAELNHVAYGVEFGWKREINIHAYAHAIKKWGLKNFYFIESGYDIHGAYAHERESGKIFHGSDSKSTYKEYTEPEALIACALWILQDMKKKNENNN